MSQQTIDQEFINLVGWLTDLGALSEKIVAAEGGWDE